VHAKIMVEIYTNYWLAQRRYSVVTSVSTSTLSHTLEKFKPHDRAKSRRCIRLYIRHTSVGPPRHDHRYHSRTLRIEHSIARPSRSPRSNEGKNAESLSVHHVMSCSVRSACHTECMLECMSGATLGVHTTMTRSESTHGCMSPTSSVR
jgi:hypothetical protein